MCVRYCVIEKDNESLYINNVGVFVMFCVIEIDMNHLYVNKICVYIRFCLIEKGSIHYILLMYMYMIGFA